MIIINKNADFSQCGIGKVVYKIEDDVKAVLDKCYENLDYSLGLEFQRFINNIGGLNGDIWNAIYELNIPIFSATAKEFYTNVKTQSVRNPGGGTYDTFADYLTLNRGVGANILSGKNNSTNFGPLKTMDTGFRGSAIILDGLKNYTTKNVVTIAFTGPTYAHAWQFGENSHRFTQMLNNRTGNTYIYNLGEMESNYRCYVNGILQTRPWEAPSDKSFEDCIEAVRTQTSEGYNVLNGGGEFPMITVKLWMTFGQLNSTQLETLNKAINEFYENVG